MISAKSSFAICTLIAALTVLLLTPQPASGQEQGKCSYCFYSPCDGQLSGNCQPSGVSTKCSKVGTECPYDCQETPHCSGSAASASGVCEPITVKLVRSLAQEEKTEAERSAAEDVQMQQELIRLGGSVVRIQTQYKDPITLTYARHGSKDMMVESQALNLSDKSIVAIRLGWIVKTPDEPDDVKLGDWTVLPNDLEPEHIAEIPAQHMDTAPLWKAGTVVRVYVAQVRFSDNTLWQRTQNARPPANSERSKTSVLLPVKPSEAASLK